MIRLIQPKDADHVAAVIRGAFATLADVLDPPPSALRVQGGTIVEHLALGGSGALHDDDGCILWIERDSALYLSRLAVLPASRGRGVAGALLAFAEAIGREAGWETIRLEVRLALDGNRRLFRRAGFVEGERHSHPGYAHPTYVAAEKRLRRIHHSCDNHGE